MLGGGKYIFRNFYKISPIQKSEHEKVSHYFAPEGVTVIQTEKLLKFGFQAAEESRLVLGTE